VIVVAQSQIYGGTLGWLIDLAPRLGIEVSFVKPTDPVAFASSVRKETKLIYLESFSNPTLLLNDLKEIASIGRQKKNMITVVDSTIATLVNQNPLSWD
jgi:O-acetylhomoserine/O-acetylserine sulfhydrylase-like pyridoxal-dependent enzyme